MEQDRTVLLGGYASKQCARRVHNDFDHTIPRVTWEPPAELQARFDAGLAFEAEVFAALEAALGPRCRRIDESLGRDDRIAATVAAMHQGYAVVLAGQLPDDHAGGRVGKPDVLVRWGSAEPPAYVPADVKHHRTAKPARTRSLTVSPLADPAVLRELPGRAAEVAGRFDDHVQLAHYTRMLQAAGLHPGSDALVGAIIGSDDLTEVDGSGRALVWHQLDAALFRTYSRSADSKKRSALERYDHEHDFRIRVAQVARRRTGAVDDPEPLVVPVWQQECDLCPWAEHCAEWLGPEAASVAITTGRLDVREWLALNDMGVSTTAGLADVDPDEPTFQNAYLSRVTHQARALERLRDVVYRAQLIRDGVTLARTSTGPLEVPAADVEVDLDIEWDVDDRVYLWGARCTGPDGPAYHSFVSWEPLDDDAERALAQRMAAWLRRVVAEARAAGRSVRVYHYSHPEPRYLGRILGDAADDLLAVFEDLLPFLRANFISVRGLGIKKVAPALGFVWRDDDPGGLQSQGWLVDARSAPDPGVRRAARKRLLDYNEDDVAATAAIRTGLRRMLSQGLDRV